MCLSKRKGTWRRSARSALAVGALTATTFAGHPKLHGENLADDYNEGAEWRLNPLVQEALALAADWSASPSEESKLMGKGGPLLPLTGVERISRSIYW